MGYSDDIGIITPESTIEDALIAFTVSNQLFGFDLKAEESGWGISIEILGVAVAFLMVRN